MVERTIHRLPLSDGTSVELGGKTAVMGILNVTPDSFSDGGRFLSDGGGQLSHAAALDAAARMIDEGADWIDVGGESTRPGAAPVDAHAEADRVLPVLEALAGIDGARISIDTTKASVARQAIEAGAHLVNDVSALGDPAMLPLLARTGAPVVLMHMRGDPRTMQRDTSYGDLVHEVRGFLADRAAEAVAGGVDDDKIVVDPGIGFGKSVDGNLTLLRELPVWGRGGRPILIGASRKSFIGAVLDAPVDGRLEGGLAIAAYASAQGAHLIRTHDVAATVNVVRMMDAVRTAGRKATANSD